MNIINFIESLGFTRSSETIFQKKYSLQNYTIRVDVEKELIFYRDDGLITVERNNDNQIQLGDRTTSNFIKPENFVVLECVDRLLRKGYNQNDIHLERRYPTGRGASGGKSDICIYGRDEKSLIVIECKTWGDEFEKERKKTEDNGGQLFSYLANDKNAKFLVLYSSKLKPIKDQEDDFDYDNLIIHVKDRVEDLSKSNKEIEEENIKLFKNANNKSELYEVWKDSFNRYFHFNGIFDDDANAYSLELKALKKKNLKSLEDATGLFNKFAEILRHNNISDNANAFNKILTLFLCKIVDEEKTDEEILDFQVKEGEEYEHIIDRLQALYQLGMKKLHEDIVYYSESELLDILKLYPRQTPLEKIENIFKELKYYTNNEFAFKEVHNKKLFIQNGRVLTEVIKLFQNYKFHFASKQQVLGDFFELLLNHGVKQSEGQFFTPIPIVRFVILSLGLREFIFDKILAEERDVLPKILDYACGAGHFLTESIEEIQKTLQNIDISSLSNKNKRKITKLLTNNEWDKESIFGIEKDYRLARTSQIACSLNGNSGANIIFGDGLENHDQLKINKKRFDFIVANPPYSVDSFKNYLNVGNSDYGLYSMLTETSDAIEVLFVERTKQLLKNGGLAGIVLPTSIFESGGVYTKAREILLKYFEIKGITVLGGKTFIASNIKTIIAFLKRRDDNFFKDREYITDDIFNHTNYSDNIRYLDANKLFNLFVDYRNFDPEDYKRFLLTDISSELRNTDVFTEYWGVFEESSEIKNLKDRAFFKRYTEDEKQREIDKRFYSFCKDIEKEKFLYFMLCFNDGEMVKENAGQYYDFQDVIIVKTGKSVEEQKDFLGYEFRNRKGQEGIKIFLPGGKLFDENDPDRTQKASYYIRSSVFGNKITKIDDEIKDNVQIYSLVDLIDFDQADFDKKINLESFAKIVWEDIWGFDNLQQLTPDFVEIEKGKSISKLNTSVGEIPVVAGGQQEAYYHNKSNRSKNIITISASGAYAGFVNFWDKEIFASDCTTVKSNNESKISTKLIYEILKVVQPEIYKLQRGQAQPHVYPRDIKKIKIPVPSKQNQKKIFEAFEDLNKRIGQLVEKGMSFEELEIYKFDEKKKIIIKYKNL